MVQDFLVGGGVGILTRFWAFSLQFTIRDDLKGFSAFNRAKVRCRL